jgi:hypothetical protein
MMRFIKTLMILTDSGFILYWLATALAWFPPDMLFKDYHDPLVIAWNWSFLPLDLLISASGLGGLWLARHGNRRWLIGQRLMSASLCLTVCSGLMAIAFWAFRGDFDPVWWASNGFLLLYPLPCLVWLFTRPEAREATPHGRQRHRNDARKAQAAGSAIVVSDGNGWRTTGQPRQEV